MNELITTETILGQMKEWVESKTPIHPSIWVDAAMKLNVLISDEHNKLFELQQMVAVSKGVYITEGNSVAMAKSKVEATEQYKEMQIQKARIGQIEEFIRIAKIRARMTDTEYKGY